MKKELFALLTLGLLLVGSWVNVQYLEKLTDSLSENVAQAQSACSAENYSTAQTHLANALKEWLDADEYTHVFIRHSEIDTTSDAFYEALGAILTEEQGESIAALKKLSYHLDSVLSMETVTLRSVF